MRATFGGTNQRSEENEKKRSVCIHHVIIIIVLETFYLSRFVFSRSYWSDVGPRWADPSINRSRLSISSPLFWFTVRAIISGHEINKNWLREEADGNRMVGNGFWAEIRANSMDLKRFCSLASILKYFPLKNHKFKARIVNAIAFILSFHFDRRKDENHDKKAIRSRSRLRCS